MMTDTEKGNKEKAKVYQVTGEIEPRESVIEGEKIEVMSQDENSWLEITW